MMKNMAEVKCVVAQMIQNGKSDEDICMFLASVHSTADELKAFRGFRGSLRSFGEGTQRNLAEKYGLA